MGSKVLRQLQDPLSLCSGAVPDWMNQLMCSCSFAFPFECKQQYFACTQLGLSRALNRLQQAEQANGFAPTAGAAAGAADRNVSLRMQRQKVRISRSRIVDSAGKVLDLYGRNKAVLEVEFFGEAGTGLGPTLEFYTIVSRELQRKTLGLWRGGAEADESDYAQSTTGLFPAPLPLAARESGTSGNSSSSAEERPSRGGVGRGDTSAVGRFRMLGRLIGKALQDNRLLDIHLSPLLYKQLLCPSGAAEARLPCLSRSDLRYIDPGLEASIAKMEAVIEARRAIETSKNLKPGQQKAQINKLCLDGVALEDLCLDFTYPGHGGVELAPNGAEQVVTIWNVDQYVEGVVDATLGAGIKAQVLALRAGFEDVLPLSVLACFDADELDRLLCGEQKEWTLEELREHTVADHGYTVDSAAVQFFFRTLLELTSDHRRQLLSFATGCPRLPVGGLAALSPKLTIVRSVLESDDCDPDDYLPSVMTCANYIKLPNYSSSKVLKEQLLKAIVDGQGSFDLS